MEPRARLRAALAANGAFSAITGGALTIGDLSLNLFTTLTTFGTPQDVTLQELRVETFCPADEHTERCLRELATGTVG